MTNKTIIHFVRHGAVQNPDEIMYGRIPRFRLNKQGLLESKATAQYLKDENVTAIYHSPLLRARQTARYIAQLHSVQPRSSALLNEINTPHEGKTYAQLEAIDWDIYSDIPSGYETAEDILRRIKNFCTRILRTYSGKTVVAVTHGDIVLFAQLYARDLPLTHENRRKISPYPATGSVTTLSYKYTSSHPTFTYYDPSNPSATVSTQPGSHRRLS